MSANSVLAAQPAAPTRTSALAAQSRCTRCPGEVAPAGGVTSFQTFPKGFLGSQLHVLASIVGQMGCLSLQHFLSVYLGCDDSKLCNLPQLY